MNAAARSLDANIDASPERLRELAIQLNDKMNSSLTELMLVNQQTMFLSINARVEAARAGLAGASFEVVAGEMKNLAQQTTDVFQKLSHETHDLIRDVEQLSKVLATQVRGTRLSDLALTAIDLIDRNLYERSCDVRWWATDQSIVNAAEQVDKKTCLLASQRLGQILDSYTVYYDIVLCDMEGRVIANGRPGKYRSIGTIHAGDDWFVSATTTESGEEFGFQPVHRSDLVDDKYVLVYSCGVREAGLSDGGLIGVLGIVFNWKNLAQTIVRTLPLSEEELPRTRAMVTDASGLVLADNHERILDDTISITQFADAFSTGKGFLLSEYGGETAIIGHAYSPGYETYRTGWYSIIIQSLQ